VATVVPLKVQHGPAKVTITVKNIGAYDAKVTATPTAGEVETFTLGPGETKTLAQKVDSGNAISTVYTSIAYEFTDGETGTISVAGTPTANQVLSFTSFSI